jgi:predicted nucleic-acid-binding protein
VIGLDTKVLVQYIMRDDTKQSSRAAALIDALTADELGYVPLIAVVELVWVLSSCYDITREQLVQALETLLRTKELIIDRADHLMKALSIFKAGKADFAD